MSLALQLVVLVEQGHLADQFPPIFPESVEDLYLTGSDGEPILTHAIFLLEQTGSGN